ncbi:MAG TPA: DUF3147 family protein [Candidatus Cloacimonadota bacterium]|nr:DUF3147 family protein [Candidatus Cloacimonadota bacterium]
MWYYLIKVVISSVLIVTISEISKRNSFVSALLASLPLVSILAIFWLYFETKDLKKISQLSTGVFWLVIPSLAFFVMLPLLLKLNLNFYLSIVISMIVTIILYFIMLSILNHFGIKL